MATNHQEELLAAKNLAQLRFAQDMEVNLGVWIDMGYATILGRVLEEDQTILEDLADEDKFEETIAKLKTKIYH